MTEYGLSVSLEGTPRTPVADAVAAGGAADGFDGEYYFIEVAGLNDDHTNILYNELKKLEDGVYISVSMKTPDEEFNDVQPSFDVWNQ